MNIKQFVLMLGVLVLVSQDNKFGNHYLLFPNADSVNCYSPGQAATIESKGFKIAIIRNYIAAWAVDIQNLPKDVMKGNTTVIN